MRLLNVACGASYFNDGSWTNLDFAALPGVKRADLMRGIPSPDGVFDAVYCSHYIEHIDRSALSHFLGECHRVLRPGGVLRLVTPDFVAMAQHYLEKVEHGTREQAYLAKLMILDQCVRKQPGGLLAGIQDQRRAGKLPLTLARQLDHRQGQVDATFFVAGLSIPRRIVSRLRRIRVSWVLKLLPKSFRSMNVSTADVGELHQWLYDFHELSDELLTAGFVSVERLLPGASRLGEVFLGLDVDSGGEPRKGWESMYIEAIKPTTGA